MKGLSPKPEADAQHDKQGRQRPAPRHGVSAGDPALRPAAFVDNRPGAFAQRQLQAQVAQSPRVQHLAQRQAMIDTSPRQTVQRQQLAHTFGHAMPGQTVESGSTGEVRQLAGTKPNQPSTDGKYRIKLSSDREEFTYENRVALGLDNVLPQHHPWVLYNLNNKGEVTDVQLEDLSVVYLKVPIPEPSGGKKLLVIDTVGYEEPQERDADEREEGPTESEKLFIDIKIGHFTKSAQQFELEGANPFLLAFKQLEHGLKDIWRTSDALGYDIDAENLGKFDVAHAKAKSGREPMLRAAMYAIWAPLLDIARTMALAPVTFVGASVFIVLNLTEPANSAVKIIDPDHPILLDTPPNLGQIPGDVMTGNKMSGGRDWNEYKDKWQASFGSGMTNFLKWFVAKFKEIPIPL